MTYSRGKKGRGGGSGGGTTTPTTPPPSDSTPDAFSFAPVTDAELSATVMSEQISVTGIDVSVDFTVTGGQVQKNGAGDWLTSGAVVSGDTLRVRLTSSASNSTAATATLTVGGVSGNFVVTTEPAAPPVEDPDISTNAEWTAAFAAAVGGETFTVAAGTYSLLNFQNKAFASRVTFRAHDMEDKPVVHGIKVNACANIMFDGIESDTLVNGYAVYLYGSTNISFTGGLVHNGEGSRGGVGVFARNCTNVEVSGNEFHTLSPAVSFMTSTGCTANENAIHDIRADGITCSGCTNIHMEKNTFKDFFPVDGDHPDLIQCFSYCNTGLFRWNNYDRSSGRTDLAPRGIVWDGVNVEIYENAFHGTDFDAIVVSSTTGVSVHDNFMQGYANRTNRLRIQSSTSGTVEDNETNAVIQPVANVGITFSNNTIIAQSDATTARDAWLAAHPDVPAIPS